MPAASAPCGTAFSWKTLLAAVCGLNPNRAGRTISTAAALCGSLWGADTSIKLNYIRLRAGSGAQAAAARAGCPTRERLFEEPREVNLPPALKKLVLATVLTAVSSVPAHGANARANARAKEPSAEKAPGGYEFSFDTLLEEAK